MSTPDAPDVSATTVGAGATKLFTGRDGRAQADLSDPFAVAELAERIITGQTRGVTLVSTQETKALAGLAYASFLVTAWAVELAMLSDSGWPQATMDGALAELLERAREFQPAFALLAESNR